MGELPTKRDRDECSSSTPSRCPVCKAVVLADAEQLPHPDTTFDAVVIECALCTFTNKARAVTEMVRVLRPGGWAGPVMTAARAAASTGMIGYGLLIAEKPA